ncbi:MAG: stage III sporulation protein AB [Clostridia bacterium]|nr:stage III sporulation protein AB [Clostridia bacterium]
MQRVLMLLLCVFGCGAFGLRLADRLKSRSQALHDMHDGIRALTSAIRHTRRPLQQIAAGLAGQSGVSFWRVFSERLQRGEDAEKAFCGALEAESGGGPLGALTKHDRALLISFSMSLGKTDRCTQAEQSELALESLRALIEGADELYAKKGRVYRVLGLFLGLGLGILLW